MFTLAFEKVNLTSKQDWEQERVLYFYFAPLPNLFVFEFSIRNSIPGILWVDLTKFQFYLYAFY